MTLSIFRHVAAFVFATALLAGCDSHRDPAPQAQAPAPSYAAVARGRVDVEGGLLNLGMPREGTLAEVDVHEGDHVQRGQPLASLDLEPGKLAVAAAQAEVDQAQAQLKLLGDKLATAKERAGRLAAAERAGAGDGHSADEARELSTELAAQQIALRAEVAGAEQKLVGARFDLARRTLRAPMEADVLRVNAQPGASVSPQGGPMFVLLPRAPRIVRAELSEAYADAVHAGMSALVTADASADTAPWPAHVLRVGTVVGPSSLEDDPQARANSRTVECVLALDGGQAARVGERVMVRFGPGDSRIHAKGE